MGILDKTTGKSKEEPKEGADPTKAKEDTGMSARNRRRVKAPVEDTE